jgi:hypothetical protein
MAPFARRLAALALAAFALVATPAASHAGAEDEARATFLLLLGKYVTWPATAFDSPAAPIVVAVVGNPSLVSELRTLSAGQKIEGRGFEIRSVADSSGCAGAHIVFVSDAAQSSALASAPPLRVAEDPKRVSDTDIAIRMHEGRVAFAVNRKDVAKRGLKLSSKLMSLASSFE